MGKAPQQIIDGSFDDFVNQKESQQSSSNQKSLEEKFSEERIEWKDTIKMMSQKLKKVFDLVELETIVYTERQRAVEYHHYLLTLYSKINKIYRKKHSEKYDFYTYQSQKRYPNKGDKEFQILTDIAETVEKKEAIHNHAKYIDQTISTIDNIIFGIKYRIELEQIARGK